MDGPSLHKRDQHTTNMPDSSVAVKKKRRMRTPLIIKLVLAVTFVSIWWLLLNMYVLNNSGFTTSSKDASEMDPKHLEDDDDKDALKDAAGGLAQGIQAAKTTTLNIQALIDQEEDDDFEYEEDEALELPVPDAQGDVAAGQEQGYAGDGVNQVGGNVQVAAANNGQPLEQPALELPVLAQPVPEQPLLEQPVIEQPVQGNALVQGIQPNVEDQIQPNIIPQNDIQPAQGVIPNAANDNNQVAYDNYMQNEDSNQIGPAGEIEDYPQLHRGPLDQANDFGGNGDQFEPVVPMANNPLPVGVGNAVVFQERPVAPPANNQFQPQNNQFQPQNDQANQDNQLMQELMDFDADEEVDPNQKIGEKIAQVIDGGNDVDQVLMQDNQPQPQPIVPQQNENFPVDPNNLNNPPGFFNLQENVEQIHPQPPLELAGLQGGAVMQDNMAPPMNLQVQDNMQVPGNPLLQDNLELPGNVQAQGQMQVPGIFPVQQNAPVQADFPIHDQGQNMDNNMAELQEKMVRDDNLPDLGDNQNDEEPVMDQGEDLEDDKLSDEEALDQRLNAAQKKIVEERRNRRKEVMERFHAFLEKKKKGETNNMDQAMENMQIERQRPTQEKVRRAL